ncbi:DUF6657 family protein [Spirochaeta dissipatitropha]
MSRIKSALELALERTEGVQGDSEKLREHERRQDGKRLVAGFYQKLTEAELNMLNAGSGPTEPEDSTQEKPKKLFGKSREGSSDTAIAVESAASELRKGIKAFPAEEQVWIREGIKEVLLNGITLPTDESSLKKLDPVQQAARAVSNSTAGVDALFQQAQQLFAQYLQEKVQLIDSLKEQFAPRLRQKEEAYAQQTGQSVSIKPESDPEFQQYLQRAMEQLQDYYQQVVDQIRQQLPQYL